MLEVKIVPWLLSLILALIVGVVGREFVHVRRQGSATNGLQDSDALVVSLVVMTVCAIVLLLIYLFLPF